MELQVGVKIAIVRDGKILLIKRSLSKYPDVTKGRWDIVGGRIDPGGSLFENLKREVLEETGMEILSDPRLIAAQDILKSDRHVVRLTYTGEAKGEVVLSEEHEEFKWLSLSELKSMGEDLDIFFKEVLNKINI